MKKKDLTSWCRCRSHLCFFLSLFLFFFFFFVPISSAQPPNNNNDNYNELNQQFNPSLAIIIVILVAALFLMGFFSIYVRHCADSPSGSALPTAAAAGRSRRAPRGLDASVIETFPILEYSEVKIHKIGKEALECAVCLCEFEDTETLRLIPKCDHVFHPECIDEWLASHTTCPVCRANLAPQPGESVHELPESESRENDVEGQNDAVLSAPEPQQQQQISESDQVPVLSEPDLVDLGKSRTLNRNRTRGSRSSRRRRFPRSHSTGHSLVQPNENTERFTLKLPAEVRKEIINRELQRTSSLVAIPGGEGSSRRGFRTGEGSSRGKILRRLNRSFKSDRWVLTMAPPFLVRGSSIRSPRVVSSAGEGTSASATATPSDSAPIMPPSNVDSSRLPV